MIIDIAVTSLCFCNGICARNHSRWLFSHLLKFCLMVGIFLGLKSLKKKNSWSQVSGLGVFGIMLFCILLKLLWIVSFTQFLGFRLFRR